MTIVLILLVLVVLRFAVIAVGAALLIQPVHACPACFGETLTIYRVWLNRLAPWYEWRWCPGCKWQGLARRQRPAAGTLGRSR